MYRLLVHRIMAWRGMECRSSLRGLVVLVVLVDLVVLVVSRGGYFVDP